LLKEVRESLKFVDGKTVNENFNALLKELLGEETAEDKKLRAEL
jgi:hypothetical protein